MPFRHPTLRDVARHARVSSSTVSRALKGDPRISVQVRSRISALAEQLHYTPNLTARNLVSGRTGTVWIISGAADSPAERLLARQLARLFRESDYHLLQLEQEGVYQYEQSFELLKNRLTDAAVMIAPFDCIESPFSCRIDRLPVPVVCFDRFWGNGHVPSVTTDNVQAVNALCSKCIGAGAKMFYAGFERRNSVSLERYKAARHAAAAAGLPFFDDPARCAEAARATGQFRIGVIGENESGVHSDAGTLRRFLPEAEITGGIFDAVNPANRGFFRRTFIARQDFKRMAEAAYGRIMLMLHGEKISPVRLQVPVEGIYEI